MTLTRGIFFPLESLLVSISGMGRKNPYADDRSEEKFNKFKKMIFLKNYFSTKKNPKLPENRSSVLTVFGAHVLLNSSSDLKRTGT